MLNISFRKIGGIRFMTIGRINFSFSVSTPAGFEAKQVQRIETTAFAALRAALA
jgi:hypothetical protein